MVSQQINITVPQLNDEHPLLMSDIQQPTSGVPASQSGMVNDVEPDTDVVSQQINITVPQLNDEHPLLMSGIQQPTSGVSATATSQSGKKKMLVLSQQSMQT